MIIESSTGAGRLPDSGAGTSEARMRYDAFVASTVNQANSSLGAARYVPFARHNSRLSLTFWGGGMGVEGLLLRWECEGMREKRNFTEGHGYIASRVKKN